MQRAICRTPWARERGKSGQDGLSLIELLIALNILGILATTMSILLVSTLRAQRISTQQDELLQTARLAMERMVMHVERANRILLPLASNPTRSILALGGFIDNDGDGLFDEDPPCDMTADGKAGIIGIDDDGDGLVDEGHPCDDDEDGRINEDPINGRDDDGDGNIDEDPPNVLDRDGDGLAGEDPVNGLDDDGDGRTDEDPPNADDDGDGLADEDPVEPVVYFLDAATKTLRERFPTSATTTVTTVLAEQVDAFQVQRLVGANGVTLLNILLRLKDSNGHVVELRTQVFPRGNYR